MAALDFLSLDKLQAKTGVDKKVFLFGAIGFGLLVVFMSFKRSAPAAAPEGEVLEEGYMTPSNSLEAQMQMQNFNDILMGQVDQELNMFAQDQKQANAELLQQIKEERDALNTAPPEPVSAPSRPSVVYVPDNSAKEAASEMARLVQQQQEQNRVQNLLQNIVKSKEIVGAGAQGDARRHAIIAADQARKQLAGMGYDTSAVSSTVTAQQARNANLVKR